MLDIQEEQSDEEVQNEVAKNLISDDIKSLLNYVNLIKEITEWNPDQSRDFNCSNENSDCKSI